MYFLCRFNAHRNVADSSDSMFPTLNFFSTFNFIFFFVIVFFTTFIAVFPLIPGQFPYYIRHCLSHPSESDVRLGESRRLHRQFFLTPSRPRMACPMSDRPP